MKNRVVFVTLLFCLMLGNTLLAQRQIDVSTKVASLTELYQLNDQQQQKLVEIQERRNRNLAQIQVLAESDPALYIRKRASLQQGTEASVRRMLTKAQLKTYRDRQATFRKDQAKLKGELKESGASLEEIQTALLDHYDEQF